MYDYCYNNIKPKNEEKPKLCYMNSESFSYIKTDNVY